jgi:plastocyanin
MIVRTILAGLATAFLLGQPAPLHATTYYIGVDSGGFFPDFVPIEQGDEVIWYNADDFFSHTSTSDLSPVSPDYWNAILFDFNDTYAKTFNNSGTFTFRDQFDGNSGTIVVAASPEPTGITLGLPRVEAGQFLFDVAGLTSGKSNVLQTSTNLTSWTSVSTNIADSSTMTFTNSATSTARFFRVYEIQ